MCYSAQIWADYRQYVRLFGADISLKDFVEIFWHRRTDARIKIPKAMEAPFANPANDDERQIKAYIDEFTAEQTVNRCIIPIKPEHIDAWLNPDPANLAAQYAILDDRARPYYEHQLAA